MAVNGKGCLVNQEGVITTSTSRAKWAMLNQPNLDPSKKNKRESCLRVVHKSRS